MRNHLSLLLLLFSTISFSQILVVNNPSDLPQLIQNVLLQNSCFNETNFLFSSDKSIGKFTNTNPDFPISNGIIIRNGFAKHTEGPYTGLNESSQINNFGDVDLQAISDLSGQNAPITDVAFLQFDFTPLSSNFSFDFLFASNEYGEFQCGFSDVFAFLLTDLTTSITTNLAVIPGIATPVSVKNIRDAAYNNSCLSANANLFSRYNVSNPAASAINMRGETVLLTASSPVIPNRTYRIKLAIGDYNDSNFDSAVFIKGGSFITTTNLGPDQSICQGENILLESGLDAGNTFSWTLNGEIILGETMATLLATQAGTYGITATLAGCVITDEVILSDLQTNTPNDITVCNTGQPNYQFDLTQNNLVSLGVNPADYSIMYFESLASADANGPQIPAGQLSSYTITGNQTIYIKFMHLTNGNTICDNLLSFNLLVNAPVNATTPPNLNFCNNNTGTVTIDLTVQSPVILNGQNPASYNISYFLSQSDAQNNISAIANPNAFPMTLAQSPITIWGRVDDVSNPSCFDLVNFPVLVSPQPLVDDIADVIECSSYILPAITNGNYYTGPNGTGTPLNAGDTIDTGGTYYIFSGPIPPNNCTNENTFTLTFIDELTFESASCGEYIITGTPAGNFFTGPSGTGDTLPPGTILTTDQTIYFYAVINSNVCRNEDLRITILTLPLLDDPADVVTCNFYTLPPLTNGNYFTSSGVLLNVGDVLYSSQNIYVFADDGTCPDENIFRVDIVDTSIYQPISYCGSYTLPAIPFGNYYDPAFGVGNIIPAGTVITSSQTVYYYADTTSVPNCTNNLSYLITINPLPLVDTPADRFECQNYTLPILTNGNYFTDTKGGGTRLNAGDIITSTRPIYIYAGGGGCTNEDVFQVEIRPLPLVDSFTDVFTCTDFTLPTLTNGTYYTATNGTHGSGTVIAAGTVISTTQTIYIYNEWNDFTACSNETIFKVEAGGVEVGTFEDINECDSYTLPPLTVGNYYYLPNGQGPIIPAGTDLTTSRTVYVYAILGTRLTCSDEDDFIVTISTTPVLTGQADVEACGSYTLPPLALGNYFSGTNGTGTAYFPGQNISTSQLPMYIFAPSPTNLNCFDQDDFNITIYPLNNLVINGGVICVDFTTGTLLSSFELVSGLDPAIFTVEWYLNGTSMGTGPNYTAIHEGTYNVVVIKNTPDIGNDCGYNPTTVIVEKSSTAIATVTVTGAFEDTIDIIVNLTGGFGIYEYQMDSGNFQTDNVFHDVPSGEHLITIHDTKGDCDDIILVAIVLNYPNYFTPNADNYHDTWNIPDLADQLNAVIYIYDRYGKFIKQIYPAGPGWDGTFNDQPLPSTDYWFHVFYKNNNVDQEFKAHFSMKR